MRIELLLKYFPNWCKLVLSQADSFEFQAQPNLPGDVTGKKFFLVASDTSSGIEVKEKIHGDILPFHCPERHINENGTFCLGKEAGKTILSDNAAEIWWKWLEKYLQLQQVAEFYGIWPEEHALAHGDAADHQIFIEEIAKKIGWDSKVLESIFTNKSKVIRFLPHYFSTKKVYLKRKGACPFGCYRKLKKPIKIKNCTHHYNDLKNLITAEKNFHESLRSFNENLKNNNFQCCKTMKKCPFNNN